MRYTTYTGCNGKGQGTTTVTPWIRWNWTTIVFQRHACSDECNASDHFPRFRRSCQRLGHRVCGEHKSSFPVVHHRVDLLNSSQMTLFLHGTDLPLWPSFKQNGPTRRDLFQNSRLMWVVQKRNRSCPDHNRVPRLISNTASTLDI